MKKVFSYRLTILSIAMLTACALLAGCGKSEVEDVSNHNIPNQNHQIEAPEDSAADNSTQQNQISANQSIAPAQQMSPEDLTRAREARINQQRTEDFIIPYSQTADDTSQREESSEREPIIPIRVQDPTLLPVVLSRPPIHRFIAYEKIEAADGEIRIDYVVGTRGQVVSVVVVHDTVGDEEIRDAAIRTVSSWTHQPISQAQLLSTSFSF